MVTTRDRDRSPTGHSRVFDSTQTSDTRVDLGTSTCPLGGNFSLNSMTVCEGRSRSREGGYKSYNGRL